MLSAPLQRLELANDSGSAADELRLLFKLRHGALSLVTKPGGPVQVEATARSMHLRFPAPIGPGARVRFSLRAPGSPVELVGARWSRQAEEAPVAALHTDYRTIDAWRIEQAQRDPTTRRAKLFFSFLDRETLPDPSCWTACPGVSHAARAEALGKDLRAYLTSGLRHRMRSKPLDGYYNIAPPPPLTWFKVKSQLESVHALFAEGFRRHFALPGAVAGKPLHESLDLEGIKDAFTWFAAGRLMMVGEHAPPSNVPGIDPVRFPHQFEEFMTVACQPDSGMFLLFAELAHAAFSRGIEEDLWWALLPALVHAQFVFLGTYSPGSGALLSDYRPKARPDLSGPDVHELRRQRQEFERALAAIPSEHLLFQLWRDNLTNALSPNA